MRQSPLIDRRNLSFTLHEVLGVEALTRYPRFRSHSRETFDATLELAHQLAVERFYPHQRLSDQQEPHLGPGGTVVIPREVKEAIAAYAAAGFMSSTAPEDEGGMQLPETISTACDGLFMSANLSTTAYPLLARGVAELIASFGTEEQKRLYLAPIRAGRYLGTMALSEPQAGSSLADITTRAEPQPDGSFLVTGAKMWISGGEHELSENIVHMVLAKIPGGPPGVKGISLLLVPRYRVHPDGSLGAPNDVTLAGINHKMGQRGVINTFLKFGEEGRCQGFLVGPAHQGLSCMFQMMNGARISVGVGATMLGYAGYLVSRQYAKERLQGRPVEQRDPSSPMVPIIAHADVRRMLLQQKVWVEGAFTLALFTAQLSDRAHHDPTGEARKEAQLLLDLLTPIVKAWPSEWCAKANDHAIQVMGGYGYSREFPVEQYYRDNRLNPIHEGTNGIQAIDLLGRKLTQEHGAALQLLAAQIQTTLEEAAARQATQPMAAALARQLGTAAEVFTTVVGVLTRGQAKLALSHAGHAMILFGHLVVAWMWLKQAIAADVGLANASPDDLDFYEGKLTAARWFFRHELPLVTLSANALRELDPILLELDPSWL